MKEEPDQERGPRPPFPFTRRGQTVMRAHYKDQDLAGSPFEIAQLAVSLAAMRGETEPALKDAVELLKKAALLVKEENRPRLRYLVFSDSGEAEAEEDRKRLGDGFIVMTPTSHPEEWAKHLKGQRSFLGAHLIKPPASYPVSRSGFWRALLGRSPGKKEIEKAEERMTRKGRKGESIDALNINWPISESVFWVLAIFVVRRLQRFSKWYNTSGDPKPAAVLAWKNGCLDSFNSQPRRRQKRTSEGTFFKPKKGEDGRYK